MRQRKGFILIFALVVALCVTLMAGALSLRVFREIGPMVRYINLTKGYYLAHSGIEYMRLKQGYFFDISGRSYPEPLAEMTFSVNGSEGSVHVKHVVSDDGITITSTATVKGVSKSVTCQLENDEDLIDAMLWMYVGATSVYEVSLESIKWK